MNSTDSAMMWNTVLRNIKEDKSIPDISYNTWFGGLQLYSIKDSMITILAPNAFCRNALNARYKVQLHNHVSAVFGESYEITVLIKEELPADNGDPGMTNVNLNPRYTFATFVVGKNNEFAHAASVAVAEAPGEAYHPLFIHGGVGLGKTHLMNAIAHYILDTDPSKKILFTTSESFVNEVVEAIGKKKMQELRNKLRTVDVLIVDDVQFLSNKTATQEEFFHTFNTLFENGKQIILSSDRPPHEIPTLEERLRSRFMNGLIVDIGSPDYETRIAILKKKAEAEHLNVPDAVFEMIANRIDTNIRELEGALNRVKAMATIMNLPITAELAESAMQNLVEVKDAKRITAELIITSVAEYFHLTVADILSAKRNREVTVPRQIGMYLCDEMTELSTTRIGEAFGGRDHTTIMHGKEKIASSLSSDPSVKKAVDELKEIIRSK